MGKMEIEVISSETITPSIPTPSHLRNFSLSLLDQTSPAVYVPVIIFYPNPSCNGSNINISTQLKVSLSEALSRFYPLAGRIKDHLSIDCNDEGALFAEAKVNCDLSEFLKQPKLELLHHFLPSLNFKNIVPSSAVHIAIQLNVFACGGISIGMLFLHKIIDGATMSSFLKFWAAAAANPANIPSSMQPNDDDLRIASKLLPPKESIPDELMFSWAPYLKSGKGVWRRFVFDAEAISALKSKLLPTLASKLFVVSSLILKHVMVAVDAASAATSPCSSLDDHEAIKKHSVLSFMINMRQRMIPPLPQHSIGNLVYAAYLRLDEKNNDMDHQQLQSLVGLQRESSAKINHDYLASLHGERGFEQLCRDNKERAKVLFAKEEVDNIYFYNSWCNMGFNGLDFGCGKPIWVSKVASVIPNRYMHTFDLLDTVSGDGIEAWLLLSEAAMNILERDQEFRAFASLNPAIFLPNS